MIYQIYKLWVLTTYAVNSRTPSSRTEGLCSTVCWVRVRVLCPKFDITDRTVEGLLFHMVIASVQSS